MSGADKGQMDRIPDRPGGSGPRTQLGRGRRAWTASTPGLSSSIVPVGQGRRGQGTGWPVLTFSRPIPLRERIPAPSGAALATTAELAFSALAAGTLSYSATSAVLRRFSF